MLQEMPRHLTPLAVTWAPHPYVNTMAIYKVLQSGLKQGAGGNRVRWGSQALSRLVLIYIVKLTNVSFPNMTVRSPSAKAHTLPQSIGSQDSFGPP